MPVQVRPRAPLNLLPCYIVFEANSLAFFFLATFVIFFTPKTNTSDSYIQSYPACVFCFLFFSLRYQRLIFTSINIVFMIIITFSFLHANKDSSCPMRKFYAVISRVFSSGCFSQTTMTYFHGLGKHTFFYSFSSISNAFLRMFKAAFLSRLIRVPQFGHIHSFSYTFKSFFSLPQ